MSFSIDLKSLCSNLLGKLSIIRVIMFGGTISPGLKASDDPVQLTSLSEAPTSSINFSRIFILLF